MHNNFHTITVHCAGECYAEGVRWKVLSKQSREFQLCCLEREKQLVGLHLASPQPLFSSATYNMVPFRERYCLEPEAVREVCAGAVPSVGHLNLTLNLVFHGQNHKMLNKKFGLPELIVVLSLPVLRIVLVTTGSAIAEQ